MVIKSMYGGLNFSEDESSYAKQKKSTFRKAGDALTSEPKGSTSWSPKTADKPSASPTAKDGYVELRGGGMAKKDNRTAGQKLATNVRPEYAKQAADFYDKINANFGHTPKTMGHILTQMGGDVFLPDPEKQKAKLKEQFANRPETLSNILTYMGGGAGSQGHNR